MWECLEKIFNETNELGSSKGGEAFTCPKCHDSFTKIGRYMENSSATSVEQKLIKTMVSDMKKEVSQLCRNLENNRGSIVDERLGS
jgi:hypothetical protein